MHQVYRPYMATTEDCDKFRLSEPVIMTDIPPFQDDLCTQKDLGTARNEV